VLLFQYILDIRIFQIYLQAFKALHDKVEVFMSSEPINVFSSIYSVQDRESILVQLEVH
jgi:hypothetical protein